MPIHLEFRVCSYAWYLVDKICEISKAKRINNEKLHDDSKTNYVNFFRATLDESTRAVSFARKMYLCLHVCVCVGVFAHTSIACNIHCTAHDVNIFQLSSDNFYL